MDPNAPVKKQRSPLFYVALGCGGLMAVIGLGVLVMVILGVKMAKGMADDLSDPSRKAANVQKMLGASPVGYSPVMTLSIPLMMDMAMLGDQPMPADGGAAEFDRGFLYFRIIANEQSNRAKDYFNGKTDDPAALKASNMNVEVKDVLKRGTVKTANGTVVKYVATRGVMDTQGHGGHKEGKPGLNTLVYFECPSDTAVRMGVWMMSDANPELDVDKLQLSGTVADENEVVKFVQPLTPCGK